MIESTGVVVRTEKAMGRTVKGQTMVSHRVRELYRHIDDSLTGCLLSLTVGGMATKVMFAGKAKRIK